MVEKTGQPELQKDMPPEVIAFCRAFIERRRWQFAKTYAKFAPHEYTVRKWLPHDEDTFEHFIKTVREYGFPGMFGRKTFTYLIVDGHKYWTMGAPIPETVVINREPVNEGRADHHS